jgi:hypothetical protein
MTLLRSFVNERNPPSEDATLNWTIKLRSCRLKQNNGEISFMRNRSKLATLRGEVGMLA